MEGMIQMNPAQKEFKKTKISNGNYDLVDSGAILICDKQSPIELVKRFTDDFTLTVRIISMEKPGEERGLSVRADGEKNTIEYTCTNFDNTRGTGTVSPIEMGTIGGKKFYIHFWIYALGGSNRSTRKLEYTIWREK